MASYSSRSRATGISNLYEDWPIVIIELDQGKGRSGALRDSLSHLHLPFYAFPAIDGRNGLPSDYEGLVDRPKTLRRFGRQMSDAEYACALSHLMVYNLILKSGWQGAVILEDDAIVSELFARLLNTRIHRRFDFLQFDFASATVFRSFIYQKSFLGGLSARRLVHNSTYATAYSVSRKAARFIHDSSLPVTLPADWPCDLRPLRPALIFPRVVTHPKMHAGSAIQADRITSVPQNTVWKTKVKNPKPVLLSCYPFLWERLPNVYKRNNASSGSE